MKKKIKQSTSLHIQIYIKKAVCFHPPVLRQPSSSADWALTATWGQPLFTSIMHNPAAPKNKHKTLAALSHTRFNYCNHLHLLLRFPSTATVITCTVSIQIKLNAKLSKWLRYTAQLETASGEVNYFTVWVNITTSRTVVLQTNLLSNDSVKLITTCASRV